MDFDNFRPVSGISYDPEIRNALRAETASIKNTGAAVDQAVDAIHDRASKFFSYGRRLRGQDLKELIEDVDGIVKKGITPLRTRHDFRPPTVARPKSEAYESMYVVMDVLRAPSTYRENVYRPLALRIFGTRKSVLVEIRPLPLAVRFHAGERFHERGMDAEGALAAIASSVVEWSLIPAIAEDALLAAGGVRLAVPGPERGSLIMGYMDETAAVPFGQRFRMDGRGTFIESIPARIDTPGFYYANTFIDWLSLDDRKRDFRQCLDQWRELCGEAWDRVLDDRLWPEREISPAAEPSTLPDGLEEALCEFVSNEKVLVTMGNISSQTDSMEIRLRPVLRHDQRGDTEAELEEHGPAPSIGM